MNRRNFLIMAFGASAIAPLLPTLAAKERKRKTAEEIQAGLQEIAFAYINDSEAERKITIEELNNLIPRLKSVEAKKYIGDFRDCLLSYNVIPAMEVSNA